MAEASGLLCMSGNMSPATGRVLVAVSGGADSVALLLAMQQEGYDIEALHCNFGLRGAESDRDERFVRHLCRTRNIPLTVKHFPTQAYAARRHISIEMAARELRYEWFAGMRRERGAVAVAVAHHKDDQAETLLLNLIRGTGIRGLCGMSVEAEGIIRPLLGATRAEIEAWLTERGQEWVVDSTNMQADAAVRNRIRLELLPLLRQMNPSITETLVATARRMREATRLYDEAVGMERRGIENAGSIDIKALQGCIAPRTLFHEIISGRGFTAEQEADIFSNLDGEPGREWRSPEWRLLRDRGRLLWQRVGDVPPLAVRLLPLEGEVEVAPQVRLLIRRFPRRPDTTVAADRSVATFDLEKLTLPLTVRYVREADRMHPFGMRGTRLVSDIMTDMKMTRFEKERQLAVESGTEIVWLVGCRAADGGRVTDDTRFIMTITML